MRRLALLLIVLSVGSIGWADVCSFTSPIHLYRDNELDLQVFFDNAPAAATPLGVYRGDKLVRHAVADQSGRVDLGVLPDGKYRVVIDHKGVLDVVVDPQPSHLNGPLIYWYLFTRSRNKWVEGKKAAGNSCPIVMLKAD